MPTWSFYRVADGQLTGRSFSGPESLLQTNTPPACAAILGSWDYLSHRVVNGSIVDWVPPAPAPTMYEAAVWSSADRRWVMQPTAAGNTKAANDQIKAQITAMEMASIRTLREAILALASAAPAPAAGAPAVADLTGVDEEIVNLRNQLQMEP